MKHVSELALAALCGAAGGVLAGVIFLRGLAARVVTIAQREKESLTQHARDWENRLKVAGAALRKGVK